MNEVIVEGLDPNDFVILEKILKTYKISLESDISFEDVLNLHNKVQQVIDYLQE